MPKPCSEPGCNRPANISACWEHERYHAHPDHNVRAAYWHKQVETAKQDALHARECFDFVRCRAKVAYVALINPELAQRMTALYLAR